MRPGPSSRRKGANKSTQTVYFKRFWTFLEVQKKEAAGRTHARTHGHGLGARPPSTTHAGKNTPFGASPPHTDNVG